MLRKPQGKEYFSVLFPPCAVLI
jgi:signal transducing adaptor molecule